MLPQKIVSWRHLLLFTMIALFCHTNVAVAKSWKEIRFGVEAEVPPFESRNAKGELVGLNIELGNALCAQMGVRCVWVDQPYANNISSLKAKRFDVIMPMTPTETRKQEIDFTDVMYQLSSRLVARKGTDLLPSTASLKGKRVGVLRGTSREAFAVTKWASAGVQIESFDLNTDLIKSLLAGKIDATLQDTIEISEALLNKSEGRDFDFSGPIVTDPMLGSGVAMGIRKDDSKLKTKLNQALTAIKANGVHQAIVARYLTSLPTISTKTPHARASLQYIGSTGSLPFSQAVRAGNTLYLSGLLGDDKNGKLPDGTTAQTTAIMNNMRGILEKNGSSLDHVIQCKVILADINDFADMNKVYASYFSPGRFPARTTFEASNLVANAKIEIECMAYTE